MSKILLNDNDGFDGIIDKLVIDNDKKKTTITIKQWNNKTHSLSILEFNNIIFQSLPDIGSFNLVTEITYKENINPVLKELNEYLSNNPSLILSNTQDNISKDINSSNNVQSYLFESGYCKDWLIICSDMSLKELNDLKN
ncbi:hypothetical protein LNI90_11670 [Tenacibaculum dicentrarchi]|nr:hypothetical protein [Tenacibaculum dicentrarchi]MCD8416081.1 hypothetical protein [Tenacibaculum dicentrarchi]MCD8421200.1 hypothetical protein [Tenacibaculum dicentrarchi]MCD8450405.1 hypothetical protein [Tenacibaculum dicentrarchi]MCD8452741.1 hypothetical protein [Tenacibaculum dicentrarchi]